MKIAFVWDWNGITEQTMTWEDGLAAALAELGKRGHDVHIMLPGSADATVLHPYFPIRQYQNLVKAVKEYHPDVILHWADFTRPHAEPLSNLGIPMAICFAGGALDGPTRPFFQHIFVESDVYWAKLSVEKSPVSIAFGTNTSLFKPIKQAKFFDTIFPATFALWKRHRLYAEATKGLKSLAVGYMYEDHEQECWQVCVDAGLAVLPHVSARALHRLYAMSKACVVTSESTGGSQRTVLEAMAMNMPVVVTDSDKFDFAGERIYYAEPRGDDIRSYLDTLLQNPPDISTRQYIVDKWSHIQYANALEEGLAHLV